MARDGDDALGLPKSLVVERKQLVVVPLHVNKQGDFSRARGGFFPQTRSHDPSFLSSPLLIRPNLLCRLTKLLGCSRTRTPGTRSTMVLKTFLGFLL